MAALQEADKEEQRGRYNLSAVRELPYPPATDLIRRALDILVDRHETLRTSFESYEGALKQRVHSAMPVSFEVIKIDSYGKDTDEQTLSELLSTASSKCFRREGPMFRALVVHVGSHASYLAVIFDHLVCDAESLRVFFHESASVCQTLEEGKELDLRPLPIQYADFSLYQRLPEYQARVETQLRYWERLLAGSELGPSVNFDMMPAKPSFIVEYVSFTIADDEFAALRSLMKASSVGPFAIVVAAVQFVIARLTSKDDFLLSTTVSGRTHRSLDDLIGLFAGVGRLRYKLAGDASYLEILEHARQSTFATVHRQDVPFAKVRQSVWPFFPSGGLERLAALPAECNYFRGTAATHWRGYRRGQLHPLRFRFSSDDERLDCIIGYKPAYYHPDTIASIAERLRGVLVEVPRRPNVRLSQM